MNNFLWFVIGLIIGTEVGYYFYYSPRAEIKRLLREMYKIPIKFAKAKRKTNNTDDYYYNSCKRILSAKCKIINDLLNINYYFDPEKDKDYIQEKKEYAQSLLDNVEKIFNK